MNLIEYPNKIQMMEDVATAIALALQEALDHREQVSLAVPGGTTPGPVFDALCGADLDWSRVHVLLTDERWVPETNPQSNAALIAKRLLTRNAAKATFTPYFVPFTDISDAASTLSDELAHLNPIDVLLLGMGADMHTASLFPDAHGLEAALSPDAPMFLPISAAGQLVQRLTLTAPALRKASSTHLLITGADKREALTRAATLPEAQAPVQTVLANATVHWSA